MIFLPVKEWLWDRPHERLILIKKKKKCFAVTPCEKQGSRFRCRFSTLASLYKPARMHARIHLCKPHHPFSTLLLKFLVCPHFVQAMAGNQKMQLLKSERRMFSSSDDNAVIKQVTATHAPDGREVEVRLILDVVEDVLKRSTPTIVVVELQCHTPLICYFI